MTTDKRPPFDAELGRAFDAISQYLTPPASHDDVIVARSHGLPAPSPEVLDAAGVSVKETSLPGSGGHVMRAVVLSPREVRPGAPCVYFIHGGAMMLGDPYTGIDSVLPWITRDGVVVVSIDYRLAPENQDPVPVEDCYAGLSWVADHPDEFGIDSTRIIVAGSSAGGGLAAGTALLSRDRGGPEILGSVLICPMLDDRSDTLSMRQYDTLGTHTATGNRFAWNALLGSRAGTAEVSIYASPSRAVELEGLPTTFLDCGAAEPFRDETVAYAGALWAAGVQAELHIWEGAFHGFDTLAPHASVSQAAISARSDWVHRLLSPVD